MDSIRITQPLLFFSRSRIGELIGFVNISSLSQPTERGIGTCLQIDISCHRLGLVPEEAASSRASHACMHVDTRFEDFFFAGGGIEGPSRANFRHRSPAVSWEYSH